MKLKPHNIEDIMFPNLRREEGYHVYYGCEGHQQFPFIQKKNPMVLIIFLTSIIIMLKTNDIAKLLKPHNSNLTLTIPTFTVLLPTFLSLKIIRLF